MSEEHDIRPLSIPARHAGMKLAVIKPHVTISNQEFVKLKGATKTPAEVLTIEDQRYSVQQGYLVPYYLPTQRDFSRRAEELNLDRARRFFYTAQPEIDVRWSREDIEAAFADYKACKDPDLKAIKAPFLVGAIVNRMERLARVYFQANTEGAEIDLTEEQLKGLAAAQEQFEDLKTLRRLRVSNGSDPQADNHHQAMEEPILAKVRDALNPVKQEADRYVSLLFIDAPEMVGHVRLRDKSTDRDGILGEFIREMAKVWGVENTPAENAARQAIVLKIGQAMEAIDETKEALLKLFDSSTVITALRAAKQAYADSIPAENAAMTELLSRGLHDIFSEYAQLCRARTGIKSEDAANFKDVRERAALIDTAVHEIRKNLRDIGRSTKQSEISELRDLIADGFQLMSDMSQMRLPRNQNAPVPTERANEERSVGRFKARVDTWLAAHHEQSQGASRA